MPWHHLGRPLAGLPWLMVAGGVLASPAVAREPAGVQESGEPALVGEGAGDPVSSGLMVLGSLLRTYALKPGDGVEGEILVRNVSPVTQVARLYSTDYRRTEGGSLIFPDAGTLPRSNSAWMAGIPQEFVIPPGATVPVSFAVRVPADLADMGTYWSVIMVQGHPMDSQEIEPERGRVTVREAFRTAVRVVTEVSPPGMTVEPSLRFANRALVMGASGAELQLGIENDGPTMLRLSIWAEAVDGSGKVVGQFRAPGLSLLPGEVGVRRIDLAELPPGQYELLVIADSPGQDVFGARYRIEIPDQVTSAWGRQLWVRRADDSVLRAAPGAVVTLALQVENRSRRPHILTEVFELPPEWRPVVLPGSFRLEPGEQSLRLIVVQPGPRAPGGRHDLWYRLASEVDPNVGGGLRTRTEVIEVPEIDLVLVNPKPPPILAGESALLDLQILNRGNTPLEVRFSAQGGRGAAVQVFPDSLSLAVGDNATVQLRVVTERNLRASMLPIAVTASTPYERDGQSIEATSRFPLDVIQGGARGDGWIAYPVALSTQHSWDSGMRQTRATVHGSGSLGEHEDWGVQFLLAATDQGRSTGWPTTVRQVWGSLALPWGEVMLGDRSFRMSELMGSGRAGRGLGFELGPDGFPLRLSGFRLSRGLQDARRTDLGGIIALGPWSWPRAAATSVPVIGIRLHGLETVERRSRSQAGRPERILALEGQLAVGAGLVLDGEYARGSGGDAWRLDAQGRWSPSGTYRVRVWEDHGFSLADARSVTYDGQLRLPLPAGVRAAVSTRYASRSWRSPESAAAGRRDLRHGGRLSRELWAGALVSLAVERRARVDFTPSCKRIIQQQELRAVFAQTLGPLSYRGELQDRGGGAHGYRLSLTYRPSRTLSARAQVLRRPQSPAREESAAVHWQPSTSLRLQGQYARTSNPFFLGTTSDRGRFSQIGLSAAMAIDPDQALRIDIQRRMTPFGGDQTGVQLAYERRLAIPMARRPGYGQLEGTARVEGSDGTTPLADALVRVAGLAQRTGQDGGFRFRALPEGEHRVRVEAPSPSDARVLVQPTGSRVIIGGGGETARADLVLYEGGALHGALTLATTARTSGLAPPDPLRTPASSLGGLGIELTQGQEVRRTWTDAEGRFAFQPLLPGIWTLRVDTTGLPPLTRLQQESVDVLITPGGVSNIDLAVLPVERRLRIADGGPVSGNPGGRS